ncbi:MAG TPA: hypothetical protein VGN57_05440 [Pirellulaceae bacterium]|jgi:hypothetical protein|nr:hypothetical protein [Pirellulaceae bacterium]
MRFLFAASSDVSEIERSSRASSLYSPDPTQPLAGYAQNSPGLRILQQFFPVVGFDNRAVQFEEDLAISQHRFDAARNLSAVGYRFRITATGVSLH